MIARLAQSNVPVRENGWLDQYELHFGEWFKQIVDWSDQNLGWLLDALIWPFDFMFDLIMNEEDGVASIMAIPWYWVAIIFFLIGATTRTTRIGVMAAAMVVGCGLLGPDYWSETTKTFGMIFVSVLLCAIIGIPLGVLCGRVDSVWRTVRPVLDAMQVVHPFVYIMPFFFFWGPGESPATLATMVFALPPLVRLTNLGVRQVPEDVVEAARAFGSRESRVLTEVQLPLARPAIMTGLNQTLLMSISMLGIAAIMGASGLGKLLLQAITSSNLPQATSGGLAYFFVAVVLDRITQRESADGMGLFARIKESWAFRKDPEGLLETRAGQAAAREAEEIVEAALTDDERDAPVSATERIGLIGAVVGSILTAIACLLTWGNDAGLASSWGRRIDETDLIGQSFMGIEASGGSMFAIAALILSLIALGGAVRPLMPNFGPGVARLLNRIQGAGIAIMAAMGVLTWLFYVLGSGYSLFPRIAMVVFAVVAAAIFGELFVRTTPRMGVDGALIASIGALGAVIGYFMLNRSPGVEQYSHGIGVWLALAGTALAVVSGLVALFAAPYTSRVPLRLNRRWGLMFGAAFAVLCLVPSMIAPWLVDERLSSITGSDSAAETSIPPEIQAEIDRLREEAGDDINKQIAAGQAITNLINALQNQEPVTYNGYESDGPGLGVPTMGFAVLAAIATLFASGLFGGDESFRWRTGTITAGLGAAALVIPTAWIASFVRSGEPRALTGNGSFFSMVITYAFLAIGMGLIAEFRRRKVYGDSHRANLVGDPVIDPGAEIEAVAEKGVIMQG